MQHRDVQRDDRDVQLDRRRRVMVVDDDPAMCEFLRTFLAERGYHATTFCNSGEAVKRYSAERPTAVILDIVMPGQMDGLETLAALKKIDCEVPIIVVSGQDCTPVVVQAMKLGAADFVGKPFDGADLEQPLANAVKQGQLRRTMASMREQVQIQPKDLLLLGRGERMLAVREIVDRVADTDVTVLIRGESGTGKELVARALYGCSPRRGKPFVKVNCAALPAELLESELFGFERGAFTGAIQQKPGKFEFANHGTMFLDEIGDLSLPLQAKLLQVLQDGEFARLGGKHDVHVDVRTIAATNQNLEQAVALGQFREDLFFRLNVVSIAVPPLRERRDEIPPLAEYFLKKYAVQYNKPCSEISRETMDLLLDHDWPGNVRELENAVKRLVVLGSEVTVRKEIGHAIALAVHRARLADARVTQSAAPVGIGAAGLGMVQPRGSVPGPGSPASGSGSPRPLGASALAHGQTAANLPGDLGSALPGTANMYALKDVSRRAARVAERALILKMLHETRWNRKQTAEILGISYKALLYKIKENGLDRVS